MDDFLALPKRLPSMARATMAKATKAKAEAEAAAEPMRTKAEAKVTVEPDLHRNVAPVAEDITPLPAEVCSHQPPVAVLNTHARATCGGLSSSSPALATVFPPAAVAPALGSLGAQTVTAASPACDILGSGDACALVIAAPVLDPLGEQGKVASRVARTRGSCIIGDLEAGLGLATQLVTATACLTAHPSPAIAQLLPPQGNATAGSRLTLARALLAHLATRPHP